MTRPTFLYCIEFTEGSTAAKVGTTFQPKERFYEVASTGPFPMRFRHVLRIADRRHAAAQEGRIQSLATRYRDRGEWVTVDAELDRLFASVPMSENVTAHYAEVGTKGRRIARPKHAEANARKAMMASKVGAHAVAREGYSGSKAGFDPALIRARLADGYGVEDILAMDGIPVDASRAEIARLEAAGKLLTLLFAYRHRLAAE